MQQRRAALLGATSRIGPAIISALLEDDSTDAWHLILVLRPSSKRPNLPPGASKKLTVHTLPSDEPTTAQLTETFEQLDCSVVISALNAGLVELNKQLADACVAAGVSRFIPADYGSVRSDDPWALDLLATYRNKAIVRWRCRRLADENPSFSWTSLVSGHFFDYGLHTELLGLDVKDGTAKLFDGGNVHFSASTTSQIGRAVVKVLANEKATANKLLLVQSFRVTQTDVCATIAKVTGRKLECKDVDARKYLLENAAKAEKGDADAVEEAVTVLGILRSDWKGKAEYANGLLGLEEEDLEAVVRKELA